MLKVWRYFKRPNKIEDWMYSNWESLWTGTIIMLIVIIVALYIINSNELLYQLIASVSGIIVALSTLLQKSRWLSILKPKPKIKILKAKYGTSISRKNGIFTQTVKGPLILITLYNEHYYVDAQNIKALWKIVDDRNRGIDDNFDKTKENFSIRTRDEHQYILKTISLTPKKSYSIQMEFREETRLIARLKSPVVFSKGGA